MSKTGVKQKDRSVKFSTRSPLEDDAPLSKPRREDDDDVSEEDGNMSIDDNENDHNHKRSGAAVREIPEKDETERKLEKLLFGDEASFLDALKEQRERGTTDLVLKSDGEEGSAEERGEEGEDSGMDDVPDADLFFLDSGTADVSADVVRRSSPATPSDEDDGEEATPAVWHDSDDERLTVSLASGHRLRKLRLTEGEDLISGKEYIRRLRRQFERLNPTPEWADPERNAKRRKKKKTITAGSDESEVSSDADAMDTDEEEEEEMTMQPLARLMQDVTNLTKIEDNKKPGGKRKLRQEVIDIQRLKDVGRDQPSSVDSLSFHPRYPLLLSSGPASTLFLHHISPQAPAPNPLLTSLHIRRTPIHTSAFAPPAGNRIFASGRRRYFHIWDLETGKVSKVNGTADRKEEQKSMERFKLSPCGRYIGLVGTARKGGGLINVLDAGTAQWIAQVRVDGRGGVADFAWWSDGEGMTVASKNGEISEWDGRLRRVVARWQDEGAVGTTVLSLGGQSGRKQLGGDRWVAVGSSSGIVNIYDRRPWAAAHAEWQQQQQQSQSQKTSSAAAAEAEKEEKDSQAGIPRNPKPVRTLDHLTTPTSHLVFSPDGQLLVMASRWKRDALRLVHLPSCTVYRNWPTSNTPLGRISAVAISPGSDLLAVANEQGRIRLWEING